MPIPTMKCILCWTVNVSFKFENGIKYTVYKKQFVIIPLDRRHRINSESNIFSKLITSFEMKHKPSFDNAFYRVFEKEISAVKVLDANRNILHLAAELMENASSKPHEYKCLISSYLYSYLIEIARVTVDELNVKNKLNTMTPDYPKQ